jgi:Ni/Fe-hydrogenase 1 B-type cytochrome subunit
MNTVPNFKPSFLKPRSIGIRLWHWLDALVLLGSLLTVGLRNTFLSASANAQIITHQMQEARTPMDQQAARDLARSIRDPMWQWHYYFGFALAGLLLFRIAIGFFSDNSLLKDFCLGLRHLKSLERSERLLGFEFALAKFLYLTFYLLLTVMAATGLSMYFGTRLGISRSTIGTMRDVHEALLWFFVVFVVIHISGVVIAEFRGYKGLTSNMIHGDDQIDDESR